MDANEKFINYQKQLSKMSLFSFFKKKQSVDLPKKLNITSIFNTVEDVQKATNNKNLEYNSSNKRNQQYQVVLKSNVVDFEKLKQYSWNGIPAQHRSMTWRLLLRYLPTNRQNQEQALARKRKDYFVMVNTYIEQPTLQQDAQEKKISKLINDDVLRTLPQSLLFRHEHIKRMMRRLLYVWHMRHPSSGYVQGINDVVTPFIVVFLSDHIKIDIETLKLPENLDQVAQQNFNHVEADAYWCLCKILDRILDNYTSSWPGIQKSFQRMKQVIKRVDPELLQHFQNEGIDFYHMYFKWVTCLLLRQFSVKIGLRLFDTYLADENNYFGFSLFILAAIILKFSKKFKKMSFQEMMLYQQNMPTKDWQQEDLSTVIAEAYVYQNYFKK